MGKYFSWLILTGITGSPLGSLVILGVVWLALDRFTFRVLPDPLQGLLRFQRAGRLKNTLANNPNDRRARFELADILVQQRRHQAAFDLLKPNLEAGDDDVGTLYLLGVAAKGSGQLDQAERLLVAALEDQPDYRLGLAALELAELRLEKAEPAGAEKVLVTFLEKRRSSVRGRVLLARAKAKQGDEAAAEKIKNEAWSEYVGMPRYQRKAERLWAWRAKPARPITYAAIVIAFGILFSVFVAPELGGSMSSPVMPDGFDE